MRKVFIYIYNRLKELAVLKMHAMSIADELIFEFSIWSTGSK
jgi:hypothetical protein